MAKSKRKARPLLVARSGMAVVAFAGVVACGSQGPMGSVCGAGCHGDATIGTGTSGGSSGSTGAGQQYCGIPDGGAVPCFPDGGRDPTTGGTGSSSSGSGSASGSGGTT